MKALYLCMLLVISVSGCSPSNQAPDTTPRPQVAESPPNLLDGIELKQFTDVERRFTNVKGPKIEDLSQAIAEVDEWFFVPEDEKQARERIENEIEKLRKRVEVEVARLSTMAVDAKDGRTATVELTKINSLLSLYPTPRSDANRARLEKVASGVLYTSRRVEDIRRLRYNLWAISKIQGGLDGYRKQLKIDVTADPSKWPEVIAKLVTKDKDALIKICVESMSTIDPAFLDPAVMDLYNYAFGLTRDAMRDDDYRIKLTKGFANPSTKRHTPSDF